MAFQPPGTPTMTVYIDPKTFEEIKTVHHQKIDLKSIPQEEMERFVKGLIDIAERKETLKQNNQKETQQGDKKACI